MSDAALCPRDTDGDGDCHLCAKHGGCTRSHEAFSAAVRKIVAANPVLLRPMGLPTTQIGRIVLALNESAMVLPPIEGDPLDRIMLLKPRLSPHWSARASPAYASSAFSERSELRAWQAFGAELMPLLERLLASQGDQPDAQTLSLQHSLAELLRSPANTPGAQ